MTQRKKFLYFGLFLNFLFFLGTSVALYRFNLKDKEVVLYRQLSQIVRFEEVLLWDEREKAIRVLKDYVQKKWTPAELAKIAPLEKVAGIYKLGPDERPEPLFTPTAPNKAPRALFDSKTPLSLFFKDQSHQYVAFLITPELVPQLSQNHLVVIVNPNLSLPSISESLRANITVIEGEASDPLRILSSTYPVVLQKELLEEFEFQRERPVDVSGSFDQRQIIYEGLSLAHEKHLVFPIYLVNQPELRQAILFTFEVRDFVLFDIFSAAVAMVLLLCGSLSLTFAAFMWSREIEP